MTDRKATTEEHSKTVGGSKAAQVIQCPGSLSLLDTLPSVTKETNAAADLGTACHEVMAAILNEDVENDTDVVGEVYFGHLITQEIYDEKIVPAMQTFDKLAEGAAKHEGDMDFLVECRVQMPGIPDSFGTADIIARTDRRSLIVDWKFGFNPVFAERNAQGQFYARGAMFSYPDMFEDDPDWPVEIIIIQPSQDEPLDRWSTTVGGLEEFRKELIAAYSKATNDDPPFNKGPACRFCRAKPICPAYGALVNDTQALVKATQDDLAGKGAIPYTAEDIADWLAIADSIEEWITAVRALAHAELEDGAQIPGYKLVQKRATRQWIDPAKSLEWMTKSLRLKIDQAAPRKVISPAGVDKILKTRKGRIKKIPDGFVTKQSSGTTMAPEDDKRPAVVPGAQMNALADKLQEKQEAAE